MADNPDFVVVLLDKDGGVDDVEADKSPLASLSGDCV